MNTRMVASAGSRGRVFDRINKINRIKKERDEIG